MEVEIEGWLGGRLCWSRYDGPFTSGQKHHICISKIGCACRYEKWCSAVYRLRFCYTVVKMMRAELSVFIAS